MQERFSSKWNKDVGRELQKEMGQYLDLTVEDRGQPNVEGAGEHWEKKYPKKVDSQTIHLNIPDHKAYKTPYSIRYKPESPVCAEVRVDTLLAVTRISYHNCPTVSTGFFQAHTILFLPFVIN